MTPDITFVTPRYGAAILGGAEGGARSLATRLAADGKSVAVLTSCATSLLTWADDYPPGTTVEDGVTVTRFSVDGPRASDFDQQSNALLPRAASASAEEAHAWIHAQGPTSQALIDAVAATTTGVIVFYPYLYHPTVAGIPAAVVPTILYPAAHRELPLELPVFDGVFGGVDGIALHTRAEQRLVEQRFPATQATAQAQVGLPVELAGTPDPDAARAAYDVGDEPFVLCLGRVDRGKGTHDLVERFARFRERRGSGRLVLAGPISDPVPKTDGVVCLGPIDDAHKFGLMAAADVFINPSFYESFSLVILEAWLVGTPVLVNGYCEPLLEHCELSGGGLFYTGMADFDIALSRLLDDDDARRSMGDAGRRYVEDRYSWPAVRGRLNGLITRI